MDYVAGEAHDIERKKKQLQQVKIRKRQQEQEQNDVPEVDAQFESRLVQDQVSRPKKTKKRKTRQDDEINEIEAAE